MPERAKHTPGPWRAGNSPGIGDGDIYADAFPRDEIGGVHSLARVHFPPLYENGRLSAEAFAISEANARLIAAAPDLLTALEEIAEGRGSYSRDRLTHATNVIEEAQEVARAAIAKAKGESP